MDAYRRATERHNARALHKLFAVLVCAAAATGCFLELHKLTTTNHIMAFLFVGGGALVLAALGFLVALLTHAESKPPDPHRQGPSRLLHD